MKMKKLLTGAALLALGVTGGATFHRALDRQARAQSGQNTAQPIQNEGADQKSAQGTKQENTAEPAPGTRGESGRAGPMRAPDAGSKATEPEKGHTEPGKTEPEKGPEGKPHSNKFQQNKSGGDRDPIPQGTETASPTQRQSRPW
jgi:hypothetical protein